MNWIKSPFLLLFLAFVSWDSLFLSRCTEVLYSQRESSNMHSFLTSFSRFLSPFLHLLFCRTKSLSHFFDVNCLIRLLYLSCNLHTQKVLSETWASPEGILIPDVALFFAPDTLTLGSSNAYTICKHDPPLQGSFHAILLKASESIKIIS